MSKNILSPERYLERIGYHGPTAPISDTLRGIQHAHIHSVPYENLDILRGVPLSLEIPDLYDKVVLRRRGGYCFELNALFAWLLRELGFAVTDYFARFLRGETTLPKRRHHVLRVETEQGPYLCDVGVGTGVSRVPLLIEDGLEQSFREETYRLVRDGDLGWIVEELHGGAWRRVYSFTEERQFPVDYTAINFFCQYAPESPFNKQAMVALRTEHGRNTLSGDEFRIFIHDRVEVLRPEKGRAWDDALLLYFGIAL